MKSTRKRNNIFTHLILPENMFEDQTSKDYKIGGIKIESNWLEEQPLSSYNKNIKSAF